MYVNLMWRQKRIRTIADVSAVDLPSDLLHKDLAWWAVTQRTMKTTKLSKLGGGCLLGYGHLLGYGRLPRTIWSENQLGLYVEA